MSVELVMWISDTRAFNIHVHPCYAKFMSQINSELWQISSTHYNIEQIDQLLIPYNGRVIKFSVMQHIVFEFDHEEDLTQFVLAWS
jgi:CMP-2-keto-3-deoxyoctulosonic acid synthetase